MGANRAAGFRAVAIPGVVRQVGDARDDVRRVAGVRCRDGFLGASQATSSGDHPRRDDCRGRDDSRNRDGRQGLVGPPRRDDCRNRDGHRGRAGHRGRDDSRIPADRQGRVDCRNRGDHHHRGAWQATSWDDLPLPVAYRLPEDRGECLARPP